MSLEGRVGGGSGGVRKEKPDLELLPRSSAVQEGGEKQAQETVLKEVWSGRKHVWGAQGRP